MKKQSQAGEQDFVPKSLLYDTKLVKPLVVVTLFTWFDETKRG